MMTEQSKVIDKYLLTKMNLLKYKSEGLVPYYYDSTNKGDWKMVEVKSPNDKTRGRIYLFSGEDLEKVNKYLKTVNELVNAYLHKIDLMDQMTVAIIIEKILK